MTRKFPIKSTTKKYPKNTVLLPRFKPVCIVVKHWWGQSHEFPADRLKDYWNLTPNELKLTNQY